ncbi:recombinase family protein [Cellulosimicrobium protaetiae]|uniref:Recombinase family protein n=1 Tax=Cellulosimicrobium protaetiae TaxID=2587808 RepID=A0A6M5ULI2_9MICO|nr:recombinase family protein [Cellulosimicrobium protaetiae]QJW38101.1 recombinase family protein [Cellulosimicrobium protaetiae]
MTSPESAAAIYVRRSSGKVGANRTLDEQESEARALAEREGLEVVRVFREREGTGASARSGKARPQWEAALAELDRGASFRTVIVWALDRADRRGSDTLGAMLSKHAATGRRILGVDGTDTSDPQQRLATIIRGEIAREYSEKLGDNVARTKRYRRESGLWLGGKPPWGLRKGADGKLEHDPATYPEARRAAEALLDGATLYSVVADLNERQVTLSTGKPWGTVVTRKARGEDVDVESQPQKWRVPTLSTIVHSPGWAGLQSIRRRAVGEDGSLGGWPFRAEVYRSAETGEPVSVGEGVITPEERAVILARLDDRRPPMQEGVPSSTRQRRSLLGTRLRCAQCGALPALTMPRKGYVYYRCGNAAQGAGRCSGYTCPVEGMDDYVIGRALIFLSQLDPDDATTREAFAGWAGEADPAVRAGRKAKELTLEAARADLARVRRLAVTGVLTEEEAAAELPRMREVVATAERELAERMGDEVIPVEALRDLQYLAETWDELDDAAQRRVIEATVKDVSVAQAPYRGARFSGPQRAVITFVDGTTWPRDGELVPHPGRAPDTMRRLARKEREAGTSSS